MVQTIQNFELFDKKWLTIFVSPELTSERDYVITHSVRSMYVHSMYVVIFVSPELSSVRDYVITHSVRSMSRLIQ